MKKSVGSFIALNRNLIVVLAVVLGVAAAGLVAWQASAESGAQKSSKISSSEPAASKLNLPTGVEPVRAGAKAASVEPRAQEIGRGVYRGVQTAVHFDVSPPLRTMKGSPARELGEMREFEERNTGNEGQLGPQDIDRTVQTTVGESPNGMPTPFVSFDSGISCGGCQPPDPNGDVGPNHFVAMGNLQFQVFNKTGTSLLGPTNSNALWAGFGGPCQAENAGDPIVLYDQLDDRWILTQFTANGPTFFNCVAISTSPDPTGTYFRYAFSTGTNFPDYPKYGMWNDALYISTREFAGASFAGVGAYAVNRAQLVAGNPAAQLISFLATPAGAGGAFNVGDGLVPSDLDGAQLPPAGAPNYFIGSMDLGGPYGAPQDALNIWKFTANFVTPASSTFTLTNVLPVAAFDTVPAFCSGRSCVPQPNTANRIDHLGYRQRPLFRAAYRNFGSHESIVTNQSVEASATMSGIRWWEIRNPNSAPVLFQDATYAPGLTDGIHRWMGAIAMDTVGNIALGFSASAATVTFPSSWYTGRLSNDPINTMPQGEGSVVNGTGSQTGGQRWGDYTDMVVDPVDDCTFWYTNEYIPVGGAWRMRIGSFKFPSCSLGPNFSLSVGPPLRDICAPANAVYVVNTTSISGFVDPVTLSASGNPAGTTVSFSPNPVIPGNSSTMTVTTAGASAGTSTINVLGTAGALTQNQNVTLKITTAAPGNITLTAPANGSTGQLLQPTFTWSASTQAATYTLEIATDSGFTNIVHTASGLTTTTYNGATLSSLTQYFWRVRGINTCGTGANSPAFSFTTALVCIVPFSNTAPITINDNAAGSPYPSNITVSGLTGTVTKVTVDLNGWSHTFPDDVDIMVVGPGGQNTLLSSDAGGGLDIVSVNLTLDDAAAATLPDGTQISSGTFRPSNFDTTSDVFPAPAPAPGATVALSVFNGTNPNGTWSLYVRDDLGADIGSISGGWTVRIETANCGGSPTPTSTGTPPPTATSTATATNTATPTASPSCTPGPATFSNPAAITINDNLPASPYPSNISVAGLTGNVTKVTVDLNGWSHTFPDDVDIMVVGPGGQNTLLSSDAGGGLDIVSVNLTLDDAAAATLPDGTQISSGTFRPSNFDTTSDVFPAPAPAPGATVALSVFNGTNPNGTWSLYVRDDLGADIGSIAGGWALHITTTGCGGTPVPTSTSTSTGTPTATSTAAATATASPSCTPAGTPGVLYDQTNNAGTNATSSQDFETANDAFDNRAADDFVVPAGQTWTVQQVVAGGQYFNGAGPAASFNVTFYADAATFPGAAVAGGTLTGATYTNAAGVFTITLPSSVVLTAGTYWVSVQARMDFTPAGQWGWTDRTTTSNSAAAWQNPGGGFMLPACVGWARRGATCMIDPTAPDQIFQIVGTTGGGGGGCPTATATSTSTGTPAPTATSTSTVAATATATATSAGTPCPAANFSNPAAITINDNLPASPYPSNISVAGLTGNVTKVTVDLNGWSHTFPDDVDIMVVGPGGQNTLLSSDAGGGLDIVSVNLTLDDAAAATLPDGTQISSGTFRPSNFDTTSDVFPAPAPAPGATVALSVFNGTNPNGTWSLYVRDDLGADIGSIAGGWALHITTTSSCGTPTATSTGTPPPPATSTATATNTATPTASPSCTPSERIADGTFEAGTPWTLWTVQTSTNFGTPLCNTGLCGTGGGAAAPFAGDNWSWFGGVGAAESATLGQNVTIPAGSATLSFQMRIGTVNTPFTDTLVVTIDGTQIASFTEPATAEPAYTLRTFDISAFANGGSHALLFTFTGPTTGIANFTVDNVSVTSGCGPVGTPTATSTGTPPPTNTATATPTAAPTCPPSNFSNPTLIDILDNLPASPYPSNISVAGLTGTVTKVTVDLTGMSHTFPDDVDIMVVGPGGQNTLLMSDAGGGLDIVSVNLTLDDAAAATLPDGTQISSGTFRPSNFDTTSDVFPAPAPAPGATVGMSVFNGTNPNGTWSLYVRDDLGIDVGSISGGWALHITTNGCVPVGTPTATATATGTPAGTSVQFSSATYTEDESQTAAITITRTGDTSGTTTVNFATSNGTATGGANCTTSGVDYIGVAQAVTFNPGETTRVVTVQICGDMLVEPTQTVNLTLTGASVGSPSTAVLSINDTANVFRNGTAICTTLGQPAAPYPSTIGVTGGPVQIGSLRVTLYDVAHTVPDSMDFLLVGPGGQQILLAADAGGNLDLVTPVTLTFSDAAGAVLPNSAPLTTGVFEPTNWEAGQASFTAPAPPAPYNEPGSTVGGTPSLLSVFGLTNSEGTWSLYMRDDAGLFDAPTAVTGCVNGGWGLEFLSSTAAQASISGRVTTANGNGIRNVKVTVTGNSLSEPLIATTGSFGYFSFEGLATGETYVVTVNARRYTFSTPSQVISLVDNVADANFIADPQE